MSLRRDTVAVLLWRGGQDYRPIALGIDGTYDRYGSIDGIRENLNTNLVLGWFLDRYRGGRFFAKDQTSLFAGDALTADSDIEELLRLVERTHLSIDDDLFPPSTVLDGNTVVFALIAQPIWDSIAQGAAASASSVEDRFARLFGPASPAAEIYAGRLPELASGIGQLAAIDEFLVSHGLRWAPASDPSQRYPTDYGGQHGAEIPLFLDQATRDYQQEPAVMAGLARYRRTLPSWHLLD